MLFEEVLFQNFFQKLSTIQILLTKFVKDYFVPIQKNWKIFRTHTNLSKNISYPYIFHSAHTPGIKNEWSLRWHLKVYICKRSSLDKNIEWKDIMLISIAIYRSWVFLFICDFLWLVDILVSPNTVLKRLSCDFSRIRLIVSWIIEYRKHWIKYKYRNMFYHVVHIMYFTI